MEMKIILEQQADVPDDVAELMNMVEMVTISVTTNIAWYSNTLHEDRPCIAFVLDGFSPPLFALFDRC